jgi:hypothetical protein
MDRLIIDVDNVDDEADSKLYLWEAVICKTLQDHTSVAPKSHAYF